MTGWIEQKRRYRQYRVRVDGLPADYRAAVDALQRYVSFFGPNAESLQAMFDDLADLFEQSAADGTPIRAIVGEDPVEFAEAFLANYPDGQWISKERARLTSEIDRVENDGS